jgi:hypothetical protein
VIDARVYGEQPVAAIRRGARYRHAFSGALYTEGKYNGRVSKRGVSKRRIEAWSSCAVTYSNN